MMDPMFDDNNLSHCEEILQIYKRRAFRKEFATTSYMAYLQYGIVSKDPNSVNDLIMYAYRQIYSKISWLDRIYTLDIASKLKNEQF
jgi:hypothetical protein